MYYSILLNFTLLYTCSFLESVSFNGFMWCFVGCAYGEETIFPCQSICVNNPIFMHSIAFRPSGGWLTGWKGEIRTPGSCVNNPWQSCVNKWFFASSWCDTALITPNHEGHKFPHFLSVDIHTSVVSWSFENIFKTSKNQTSYWHSFAVLNCKCNLTSMFCTILVTAVCFSCCCLETASRPEPTGCISVFFHQTGLRIQ